MRPDLKETIAALGDWQTIICCRGLVLLMDQKMARDPRSSRPPDLAVTDFNQWVQLGDGQVRSLVAALCDKRLAVTAATGRRLMQASLRWGWRNEVYTACRLVDAPVDHLGTLSPITIVAALATVMQWHPDHPTLEALLQPVRRPAAAPGSERRFAWFQTPSRAPKEHA
jgi:hypothetical protein